MSIGDAPTDGRRDPGVEGERANSEHWRRVAQQQAAALRALRGRTSVRAALAVERHLEPVLHPARVVARRAAGTRRRVALAVAAAPNGLRRRRAARAIELLRSSPAVPATDPRDIVLVVAGATDTVEHLAAPDGVAVVTVVEPASFAPSSDDVVRRGVEEPVAAAAARAVSRRPARLLCFSRPTTFALQPDWLARLAAEVRGDVAVAAPLVVHPRRARSHATPHDLLTKELGLELVEPEVGVVRFRRRERGARPVPGRAPEDVPAVGAACVLVDAAAYRAVGGLRPLADFDAAIADLCWRIGRAGPRVVAVPSVVVADTSPVPSLRELRSGLVPGDEGTRELVASHGPALLRAARGRPTGDALRVAITVSVPSAKIAWRWGDWHLANALARALERLGHEVLVATHEHAEDLALRACDVHLAVRGLADVRRTEGQRHVLWVISHPEAVTSAECDAADLVLVASEPFAVELRGRTTTPVEVFLQATDQHRFRRVARRPEHSHPVAVVAKTREVMRPIVADALAAGLRPAIYGSGWEEFVDPELIVSQYVRNEDLPAVYSSVGVLLNDHWETMRAWGFVSNRLFDALACATPVVSDHLDEVRQLFGDAVPTYGDADELGRVVAAILGDPDAARRRAEAGRALVLSRHTFDHRARGLLDALARHGLLPPD
jgi:glycosyltransferase involved in cell wall biosynthesis